MRGPAFHGVLLIVALGVGYQTWTRDKSAKMISVHVSVWKVLQADIQGIKHESPLKAVSLERRQGYWWAKSTRFPPKKATPDAGPAMLEDEEMPAADSKPLAKETVREFPVGDEGQKLFERISSLMALRDLGVPDDKQRGDYGLSDSKDKLTIKLESGARELQIGSRVYGGNDRYVLEPQSGHVYVVEGDVVAPLETAESTLRESKLHGFKDEEVTNASIKNGAKERLLVRPSLAKASSDIGWADPSQLDVKDTMLTSVMGRIGSLVPVEYRSDLTEAELTLVAHISYVGKSGALGELDLYKQPAKAEGGEVEYFLKTERTHVLATVRKLEGDRIEQDLIQLLGS